MREKTVKSFVDYCEANPKQRFWQALRNWSNEYYEYDKSHIYLGRESDFYVSDLQDTWELE